MRSQQKNISYLWSVIDENGMQWGCCHKCRKLVGMRAFDPVTSEIPSSYFSNRETNWFEKFLTYRPVTTFQLKTTNEELAEVWGVSVKTIERALEKQRLLIDSFGNIFINSHPWEPQSICIDCRDPIKPVEMTDEESEARYLELLQAERN
jgi:hypothetical protein